MIYVNQSWKKKKFTSMLNCLFIISSKEVWNTDDPYVPPQWKKKKVHKPSVTEEKFRDTDAVHGMHAPLFPPQKYD